MNRVLFTHSYFLRFDPKQWETAQPYPPLGTLYAAALLRENGCEVALFDTMFAARPQELITQIQTFRPDILVIYDDGFNYLTKMCLTNMREAAFEMSRIAKQTGCTVMISSSDSTDHFEQYLDHGADAVLLGEAEMTLLELVQSCTENGEAHFSKIEGIAFRMDGCTVQTPRRKVMKALDDLPMPAWDLVHMQPYRDMWMKSTGYFSLNAGTTRGCPFKCNWCAKPIYGNRYNSRSPEMVVKELAYLQTQFHVDHIWFCDDIFGLKPGWVEAFAGLMEQHKLSLRFKIQSRADLLVQENYIKALARAGCDNVWMGAESGSQRILDAMDKGITVEQIETATHMLKTYHIKPSFFLQFGYLGETKKDIQKTIRMVNRLLPHSIGISVSYPLPGTLFYEKVKSHMQEKTNWTDSDELALMFRNTFQPAFYKQLHAYVHRTYRLHLALDQLKSCIRYPFRFGSGAGKRIATLLYYFPAAIMARQKLNRLAKQEG